MAYRLKNNEYLGVRGNQAHYFEIAGRDANTEEATQSKEDFNRWKESPIDVGSYKVIPFGSRNDLDRQLQETIFPNHLAPRILDRKAELLFGQGPYLYELKPDGKEYTRIPKEDPNIKAWLNSIDADSLLVERATEYYYGEQIFGKVFRSRGARVGRENALSHPEGLSIVNCRLAYHREDRRELPTHVVVGDWQAGGNIDRDFEIYPLWDYKNPLKHAVSVHYTGFKSFGLSNYVMPSIYGSLNWIKRSTSAPKIIEAFTNNSLNVRFHITSPQEFWDDQERVLMDNCKNTGKTYSPKMLEELENEIFDSLTEVLSGPENVGKFWHNKTVTKMLGHNAQELGWKITPIKQEVKEYVDAQISVANKSDFSVQAGLGLHAALANVGADGKSDSGSEQLYAYQIHQLTGIPLPEMYVCKIINDIIRVKFNTNLRLGFYQVAAQKQQDESQSNRTINQTA